MGMKVEVHDGCLARGSSQGDVIILIERSWVVCLTCLKQTKTPHDPIVRVKMGAYDG